MCELQHTAGIWFVPGGFTTIIFLIPLSKKGKMINELGDGPFDITDLDKRDSDITILI